MTKATILAKNISHKLSKYKKNGQDSKNAKSNFAYFLTAIVNVYFMEGRLGTRLLLLLHLTFF